MKLFRYIFIKTNLFNALIFTLISPCRAQPKTDLLIDSYSYISKDLNVVINVNEFENSTYKKGIPYSDLFSKVEYVQLSDIPHSTLGNVTKMEITKERDFILFDEINGGIFRFDASGKFLNNIGCKGHAKGEYICPVEMQYDPFNNQIAVSDRGKKRIMFYNLKGEYISCLNFDFYFSAFGIIDKDYIVIYMNHEEQPQKGEMAYNYKVYDRNGKLVGKYEPYGTDLSHFWPNNNYTFSFQNGRLIVNEEYMSPIFTFEKDEMKPLYYLNFGKWQIPTDKFRGAVCDRNFSEWIQSHEYVYCQKFYETGTAYIMQLIFKDRYYMIHIQDKNDSSKHLTGSIGSNDIYGIASKNNFQYIHDNKMYMVFDPSHFEFDIDLINRKRDLMVRRHKQITEKEIALLKQMSKNPNPIIQICTLK